MPKSLVCAASLCLVSLPGLAAPLQLSGGASIAGDLDHVQGWRVSPGVRADVSAWRRSTEDAGVGLMFRADFPAARSWRAGVGPEAIVPLWGGALGVLAAGPLLSEGGVAPFARLSVCSKSPNRHGHYGMHSGLYAEVSSAPGALQLGALSVGLEVDFELLALPVLAAARPFGPSSP